MSPRGTLRGYDAGQAPLTFLRFLEAVEETGVDELSAFGDPGRLEMRIDHYQSLLNSEEFASARTVGERTNQSEFQEAIAGLDQAGDRAEEE